MSPETEKAWSDLNLRLYVLETRFGLSSALHELEAFHIESGFIRDSLDQVERRTLYDPSDPTRFFHAQYNPRRALRFAGSGRNNGASPNLNGGCFLCRANIIRQQAGAQIGYRLTVGGRAYLALTNPFPLMAHHMVIASADHKPQEWSFGHIHGFSVSALVHDLVHLADRLPGHVGFYNGVDAGASIAGHFHFQFIKRPAGEPAFPLERAAAETAPDGGANLNGSPDLVPDYPLDVVVWHGPAAAVIARAEAWLAGWSVRNAERLAHLSANLICARDDAGAVALYFVPRDRERPKPEGFAGFVGGLEVLGEIVLSSVEEKEQLDAGEIDYGTVAAMLADVRAPLEPE